MGTNQGFGYTGVREESSALDVDRITKLVFPDGSLEATGTNEVRIKRGFGNVLNILDFDSTAGSGSATNDTAAFIAAHNALPASGGIIELPLPSSGRYYLNSTVTFTKPVILRGLGGIVFGGITIEDILDPSAPDLAKCVVIEWTGGATEMMKITDVHGMELQNLVLDGADLATHVVKADRMRGSYFRNVGLMNATNSAFILGSSSTVNDGAYMNQFDNLYLKGSTCLEENFFDGGTTGTYHNTFNHFRCHHQVREKTFTADAATDVCTTTGHGYANGRLLFVRSTTTLPGGLAARTPYYVINTAANTFKLSLTRGGSAINITSAGTGTHSAGSPGIALLSGDQNAINHLFCWNYDYSTVAWDIGPSIFIGPSLIASVFNPYGNYNNYLYHIQAQRIVVADDNPNAGVIFGLDKANGEAEPEIGTGSKMSYTVDGVAFNSDPGWHIAEKIYAGQGVESPELIKVTKQNAVVFRAWSGDATKYAHYAVGRTADEAYFTVSPGATFSWSEAAGDLVFGLTDTAKHILLGYLGSGSGPVIDLSTSLAKVRRPLQITDGTNLWEFDTASCKMSITGPVSDLTDNPGVSFKFTSDSDPALGYLVYAHDNIAQAFDAWWDGGAVAWRSSHAGSNFALYKNADELLIGYNAGTAKGSTFASFATGGVKFSKDGKMGIGTSPAVQFHTTGAVRLANFGAGTATFDASGNVSSVSDERVKKVLRKFPRGLAEIRNIKPIVYKWKKKSGMETKGEYSGFSAQNVQESIPEAVGQDKDGMLSLQDRGIIAALVNAVKELDAKVARQQKEIERLKAR